MKKLSLVTQISIIFIVSFLITSLILAIFITRRLDHLFEDTVFDKLEAEAKAIRLTQDKQNYEAVDGIAYIRYIRDQNTYYVSDNMMDYIDDDAANLLIGKAIAQNTYQERYENTINGGHIYYVVINYQGVLGYNEDILITMSDISVKISLIKATRRQIYFLCIIAFSLGYMIVLIWVYKFVDDTRKISISLQKIGADHYRSKITTKRKDEMGQLVGNIESMRLKIIENERMRQEVIQGVSHDLKTPIALISSYAEAYQDGMCEVDELVNIAKKETKRLNAKVSKLLNLTRLGYIDTDIKTMKNTDMKKMLTELISLYNYQEKIKIKANLSPAKFLGDRESWFIAAQNILDNALRYAESEIEIELKDRLLRISNDGKKIDEDVLPKIFQAYKKGEGGNFGIGLSIVKRTVEVFGYRVRAVNDENGVSFIIFK
jgi:two-component system sensor histidine kinase CssS